MIAWKKIAKPKEEGGLGIKDLKEVMQALHMKIVWFILSKNSLIGSYMQGKYKIYINGEVNTSSDLSSLWSSIVGNWNILRSNIVISNNRLCWKPYSTSVLTVGTLL